MALYVYGIMRADDAARAVSAIRAAHAATADAIEHEAISAVVRVLPDTEVRLGREAILGHSNVLQTAFEHGPVVPMRLGTAMPDADTVVREVLAPRAQALAMRLEALDGKAEMQVKATYAEEPLLRSILDGDPALKRAVERNRGLPPAATHFDQIRIGEAIAHAVQARQAQDSEMLLDALRPLALAVSVSRPHHERAVLNAAFLVDSDGLAEFDRAVEQMSRDRGTDIEFKLIGPLPAYSFVEGDWEAVGTARKGAGWA
jgi:gas vesicle protein GvpL/GvpF